MLFLFSRFATFLLMELFEFWLCEFVVGLSLNSCQGFLNGFQDKLLQGGCREEIQASITSLFYFYIHLEGKAYTTGKGHETVYILFSFSAEPSMKKESCFDLTSVQLACVPLIPL